MAEFPHRLIPLEGAFNFRDLGGYRGLDGREITWRKLFRADGLFRLSETDLEALAELGIANVIDLRTREELEKYPRVKDFRPGLGFHHLPMFDVLPPEEEMEGWKDPAYVADEYWRMFQAGQQTLRASLELMMDPASYPLTYHCMAGKDRTGILSALTLTLLGVDRQVILEDYSLSRAGMERMVVWVRANRPEMAGELDTFAAAWVAAEPESMDGFLTRLEAEHGSVGGWAASIGLENSSERLGAVLFQP